MATRNQQPARPQLQGIEDQDLITAAKRCATAARQQLMQGDAAAGADAARRGAAIARSVDPALASELEDMADSLEQLVPLAKRAPARPAD